MVPVPPKFQLYKDAAGKFRFRVVAENGQNVASSEAYEQYGSCIKGINSVKKNSRSEVEDLTINDRKVLNPKYQIYKDAADEFRFRLKASNGEIIAQSEGYETKDACKSGIDVIKRSQDGKIDESILTAEVHPVGSDVADRARIAKAAITEAKVEIQEVKMPEVKIPELKTPEVETSEVKMPEAKTPEVAMPEIKAPEVKVPETEMPEAKMPEIAKPELETKAAIPQLEAPEPKQALPEVEELREKFPSQHAEAQIPKAGETEAKPKGMSVLRELVISFIGLIIALILSALALGIANWGIGFFGITGDVAKAAAIIAVAIVIGPTIAAFATKKYF